jgi:hypothetical protein
LWLFLWVCAFKKQILYQKFGWNRSKIHSSDNNYMILKELFINFHLILKKKDIGTDLEMKNACIEFISIFKNLIFELSNLQMNISGKFYPLKISQKFLKLKGFSLKLSPHPNSN